MTETSLAIETFEFEQLAVRVSDRDGAPWFVLVDVCRALGLENSRNVTARLDEDERDDVHTMDAIGRNQNTTIISESGLYSLILTSRKPAAKRFKKRVTAEVLPAIRRTGRYDLVPVVDTPDPGPAPQADLLDPIGHERARVWVEMIRVAKQLGGVGAARDLWTKSPLPPLRGFAETAGRGIAGFLDGDIATFLDCQVKPLRGGHVQASALYGAYADWTKRTDRPCATLSAFGRAAHASGLRRVSSGGRRYYLDIALADGRSD